MLTIDPINFNSYPQPEWNASNSVIGALEVLQQAHNKKSSDEAYGRFLSAVGNDHAGTYYPVVLAVLPQIEKVLNTGGVWAKRAGLEALIDLGGSFIPEPGHEFHCDVSVKEALQAAIRSMRPVVAPLMKSDTSISKIASDLIELIDDQVV